MYLYQVAALLSFYSSADINATNEHVHTIAKVISLYIRTVIWE